MSTGFVVCVINVSQIAKQEHDTSYQQAHIMIQVKQFRFCMHWYDIYQMDAGLSRIHCVYLQSLAFIYFVCDITKGRFSLCPGQQQVITTKSASIACIELHSYKIVVLSVAYHCFIDPCSAEPCVGKVNSVPGGSCKNLDSSLFDNQYQCQCLPEYSWQTEHQLCFGQFAWEKVNK